MNAADHTTAPVDASGPRNCGRCVHWSALPGQPGLGRCSYPTNPVEWPIRASSWCSFWESQRKTEVRAALDQILNLLAEIERMVR